MPANIYTGWRNRPESTTRYNDASGSQAVPAGKHWRVKYDLYRPMAKTANDVQYVDDNFISAVLLDGNVIDHIQPGVVFTSHPSASSGQVIVDINNYAVFKIVSSTNTAAPVGFSSVSDGTDTWYYGTGTIAANITAPADITLEAFDFKNYSKSDGWLWIDETQTFEINGQGSFTAEQYVAQ